jgi:hypothetical protein
MKVTVLWEDSLSRGTVTRQFGPHELLVACLEDDLRRPRWDLSKSIFSNPRNGRDKVRLSLRNDLDRLRRDGPVVAVIDRDRARELWPAAEAADCMSGIKRRLSEDAPGDYEVVFLHRNVESLVEAVCAALRLPVPAKKPNPNDRDEILLKATSASIEVRGEVRRLCASFDRLEIRVGAKLQSTLPASG